MDALNIASEPTTPQSRSAIFRSTACANGSPCQRASNVVPHPKPGKQVSLKSKLGLAMSGEIKSRVAVPKGKLEGNAWGSSSSLSTSPYLERYPQNTRKGPVLFRGTLFRLV